MQPKTTHCSLGVQVQHYGSIMQFLCSSDEFIIYQHTSKLFKLKLSPCGKSWQIYPEAPNSLFQCLVSYQLRLIGRISAGVAVGVHEQLGVGVDGDEGLEVAVSLDQVHHVLHLDFRVSRGAVVGIGAGAGAGAGAWREEFKWLLH